MIVDFDDFGSNHIISDQCQSHDCRKELDSLHYANPNFKVTLFSIPAEMTYELLEWCRANSQWVQLALHGFYHRDNWECSKMTYEEFDKEIMPFEYMLEEYFVKGFKAPGWQISDGVYRWLADHGYWVADQSYNNVRRFKLVPQLKADVNNNGNFVLWDGTQDTDLHDCIHGHTWNCVGNGIEETYPELESRIRPASEFKFIGELM